MTDKPPAAPENWRDWFDRELAGDAARPETDRPAPNSDRPIEHAASGDAAGDAAWVDELLADDTGDITAAPGPAGARVVDDTDATPEALTLRSAEPSATARFARRVAGRPMAWAERPWPIDRVVRALLTVGAVATTTLVMAYVTHFNPLDALGLRIGPDDLIFDNTTPAGGDMGAHVWAPAYLRDHLLPNWRLNGWSMDWYLGLPVYRFYMVVPALAIVALDVVLPYGVAFKVVAVSGMMAMPFCCWAFGRLARFRYPMPELFTFAGLCFVLNESYTIWGGNVLSTSAGEFSFSIAVALMMVGLGFLCRALSRETTASSRHIVAAASFLALACLSHGIVLIYTAMAAIVIVACRFGADLWPVLVAAGREPTTPLRRALVNFVVWSPGLVALTLFASTRTRAVLALTAVVVVAAVAAVVVVVRDVGRGYGNDAAVAAVFNRRVVVAFWIGLLTLVLSAFWVGPFLFNHEYMTDMKYGYRPDASIYRGDSYWDLFFDQKLPLDILINVLALAGALVSVVRRNVVGTALAIATLCGVALTYAAHDSLPIIGLLWNPRVLPFVYLMRYVVMMIGVYELVALLVNVTHNRRPRDDAGMWARSCALLAGGVAVLVAFGWAFQVLPGGGVVTKHGQDVYAWGPFAAPAGQTKRSKSDSWIAYNWNGYERRPTYGEYHALIETMATVGETHGCGRALWERDKREGSGNVRYGSSMALMLLPHWTDGCIGSSEGLYFEASGTTPYHFLAAGAVSDNAGSPVRQTRDVANDGEVGVRYLQQLGIQYVMLTRPDAISEADAQPELHRIAESGPWVVYSVDDADIVVPLVAQPVVVNKREGDQRECWLEIGSSYFQQPEDWSAVPVADGPSEWQRVDAAIDESRQTPAGQGTDGCGDPQSSKGRDVNIVVPGTPIESVPLPTAKVSNVEIGNQSVSFDVDRPGVPVLVKVSYFPNWNADGAQGPYRAAPNFMVVVPTSTHVSLTFAVTTTDIAFNATTALGLVGCVVVGIRSRVRRAR